MKKRIYLDYASITPLDARVLAAMMPFLKNDFANATSLYKEGVHNKKRIELSRKQISNLLSALPSEIIFTSGGTEANNLAILGVFKMVKALPEYKKRKPHFITTNIEHPSVLEIFQQIEKEGGEVSYISVDDQGLVSAREIRKVLKNNTVLISVMLANNEIGTIQPIKEIAKTIGHFRKEKKHVRELPYFHSDASQAANYLELNVEKLGIDLMTVDGSKIYGPRGAGVLYARRGRKIEPIIFGGGQESGRRPGTENAAAIVGLAVALQISEKEKVTETKRLSNMRDHLIKKALKIPGVILNGHPTLRLPNNINLCFPDLDSEFAVLQFDAAGIAISSVTSCRNLSEDSTSYVIEALGRKDCAKSSLRISLGRFTTKTEIDKCLEVLYNVINNGGIN